MQALPEHMFNKICLFLSSPSADVIKQNLQHDHFTNIQNFNNEKDLFDVFEKLFYYEDNLMFDCLSQIKITTEKAEAIKYFYKRLMNFIRRYNYYSDENKTIHLENSGLNQTDAEILQPIFDHEFPVDSDDDIVEGGLLMKMKYKKTKIHQARFFKIDTTNFLLSKYQSYLYFKHGIITHTFSH
jgi:hypothetical protein